MTSEEAIQQFGLPASKASREAILQLLQAEIEREREEIGDQELLRTFCAQLFSIGSVEDALPIWAAKNCNFDTMCGLDVQFLCGAGLQSTKEFLAASATPSAADALEYLAKCERGGDFADFTPARWLAHARFYYKLDDSP
jgi:hypothetical protein